MVVDGGGFGRGGGVEKKSIKIISIYPFQHSEDGKELAMEALPVREYLVLPVPEGPDKLSLNNVIHHGAGPLALPHKESKHTNNYTL